MLVEGVYVHRGDFGVVQLQIELINGRGRAGVDEGEVAVGLGDQQRIITPAMSIARVCEVHVGQRLRAGEEEREDVVL